MQDAQAMLAMMWFPSGDIEGARTTLETHRKPIAPNDVGTSIT